MKGYGNRKWIVKVDVTSQIKKYSLGTVIFYLVPSQKKKVQKL